MLLIWRFFFCVGFSFVLFSVGFSVGVCVCVCVCVFVWGFWGFFYCFCLFVCFVFFLFFSKGYLIYSVFDIIT